MALKEIHYKGITIVGDEHEVKEALRILTGKDKVYYFSNTLRANLLISDMALTHIINALLKILYNGVSSDSSFRQLYQFLNLKAVRELNAHDAYFFFKSLSEFVDHHDDVSDYANLLNELYFRMDD